MKKIFFSIVALGVITFTSCNNSRGKTEHEGHDMSDMNKDTVRQVSATDDKEVKAVNITFTNLDQNAAAFFREIVGHYLDIKNALANDNDSEAASAAKAMYKAIRKLDKSLLTADQKKIYDAIEDDLKEHAEHIGKNADEIKHQRLHFSMMSEDVYYLVKAFGGGRTLYHDHCPMYNENKGAMWLSESKDIRNPYFGNKMMTCGSVEEMFK